MRRSAWMYLMLLALSFALVGCGGGGDSTPATPTAPVSLAINWAGRSRAVDGPASALSAIATLTTASASNTDITLTINRQAAPAAYTQTYNFTTQSKLGNQTATIRFYSQADGGGSLVGTASAVVNVTSEGGTVPTVTTTTTVNTVELAANQTVNAGEIKDLTITARDANNAVVAVTPGGVTYQIGTGADKLRITNSQIEGVLAGTATVTATVDGKTSAAANVQVAPVITALAPQETAALYGTVRARVRGIGADALVSAKVSTQTSAASTVAFTDANAPNGTTAQGGGVDFRVPYGLGAGAQNLILTVNGVASAGFVVQAASTNPFAVFTLANGNKVVAELRRDKAPTTVDNFVGLATGTKQWTPSYLVVENEALVSKTAGPAQNTPLYDGVTFHRIANLDANAPTTKIIQLGDPITKQTNPPGDWTPGTGGPGFTINRELSDLTHVDGALAMARGNDPNSAGSQFYICDGPQAFLDGQYAVFGLVVEGLTNARAITQGNVLTSLVITGKLSVAQ